jgi:hypothetical protein
VADQVVSHVAQVVGGDDRPGELPEYIGADLMDGVDRICMGAE